MFDPPPNAVATPPRTAFEASSAATKTTSALNASMAATGATTVPIPPPKVAASVKPRSAQRGPPSPGGRRS